MQAKGQKASLLARLCRGRRGLHVKVFCTVCNFGSNRIELAICMFFKLVSWLRFRLSKIPTALVLLPPSAMITTLFPSFVYSDKLMKNSKTLEKDLLFEAYKFRELDLAGQKWSQRNYPGGYTSYGSIANLHKVSSTFEQLEKQLERHVKKFVSHLEMDISMKNLKMTRCWVNIMPAQVNHSMHIHPLSVVSGTFYLKTPKDCSALKFEDPRMEGFMASPPRKEKAKIRNQRYFNFHPKPGQVVLFESWMRHEVPRNLSKSDRVSISFNFDWVEHHDPELDADLTNQ